MTNTTHPATVTTTDQNTGRTITWDVGYFSPCLPNTLADAKRNGQPWTHMIGLSRPKGRRLYSAWAEVNETGEIVQMSNPVSLGI